MNDKLSAITSLELFAYVDDLRRNVKGLNKANRRLRVCLEEARTTANLNLEQIKLRAERAGRSLRNDVDAMQDELDMLRRFKAKHTTEGDTDD